MTKFLNAAFLKVRHEPLILFGAVIAGINAATDQTWRGYALAGGAALLRFFFSPAY